MKNLNLKEIQSFQFIQDVKNHPEVEKVYLYGSRARGDHNIKSDIDIAIKSESIEASDWQRLKESIENNKETLVPIDMVLFNKKTPSKLKESILKEGICL